MCAKVGVSSEKGQLRAATAASRPPSTRGPLCAQVEDCTLGACSPGTLCRAASAASRRVSQNGPPRDPSSGVGLVHGPGPPRAASAASGNQARGTARASAESVTEQLDDSSLAASAATGEAPATRVQASSDPAATPHPLSPSGPPSGGSLGVEGQGARHEVWQRLAQTIGDGVWIMGELGEQLQVLVRQSPTFLGSVLDTTLKSAITRGRSLDGEGLVPKELMPLPFVELSADDMRDLYKRHARGRFGEFGTRWHGGKDDVVGRIRGAVAWVAVMVAALNFMHAGVVRNSRIPVFYEGPASSVQMEIVHLLYLDADDLMGDNCEKFRSRACESEMDSLRMDCHGVSVAEALDLMLGQVVPALPPR